jgi:hypothetical protein
MPDHDFDPTPINCGACRDSGLYYPCSEMPTTSAPCPYCTVGNALTQSEAFDRFESSDPLAIRWTRKHRAALLNVSRHSWGRRRRRSYWENTVRRQEAKLLARFHKLNPQFRT